MQVLSKQNQHYNILLVEDNPGDARLIIEIIKEFSSGQYAVFNARSLKEGVEKINNHNLDAILLDLSLPDSFGLETFSSVYEYVSDIPIIILTGLEDEKTALEAVEQGAQDYLSKGLINGDILKRSIQYSIKRKKLEEQFQLLATALHSASNSAFVTNREGEIEWINPAFTKVTGYSAQEIIGKKPNILKSDEHDDQFYKNIWETILAGNVWQGELVNKKSDGSLFFVEQTITPFSGHRNEITNFVAIQQDITQRKKAEAEEQNRLLELESLLTITTALREADNLSEALSILLDQTLATVNLNAGLISLFNPKTGKLHREISRGWFNELSNIPLSPGEGISGKVFQNNEIFISDDFKTNSEIPPNVMREIPDGWGGACVPIIAEKSAVGVIFISCQLPRTIQPNEIKLLKTISELAGTTIHRLKLYEESLRDAKQMALVNQLGTALTEIRHLNDIYHRLQSTLNSLMPETHTVRFFSYNHSQSSTQLIHVYTHGKINKFTSQYANDSSSFNSSYIDKAIQLRTPILSENPAASSKEEDDNLSVQSEIFIPLLAKDTVVGLINLQSSITGYYTQEQANLLSVIGNTAAVAIENARLFEETQLQLNRINALRKIDIAITADEQGIEQTLQVLLNQVISQLNVDAANVLLVNEEKNQLEFASGLGFESNALQYTQLAIGDGIAGKVALERNRIAIHSENISSNDFARSPQIASEGFKTYFGVPLVAKNKTQGVLEIFLRSHFEPNEEWFSFLDALAGQAAIAIDNFTLFNNLEKSNLNLFEAYDATIEGWSKALDFRDQETENHTLRVTELTIALARQIGVFDEREMMYIRWGALLHDIGKMGIPDSILLKPDKLTDEEMLIIKKHPQYAYDLISPIKFLSPALDIPFAHHEKWDGTGYPRKLKGDEIPLSARLFAVVDVWDALRSDRPYRASWPEEKVLAYLKEQSGSHFDPQAVEAFELMLQNQKSFQTISTDSIKPTILIVDDEEFILRSLTRSLRNKFTIITAHSGEDAIQILQKVAISIILTDQRMPTMTGLELLLKANEISPQTKGVLISGYSDSASLASTLELNTVCGFIPKPWNSSELLTTLNSALN